MQSSGEYADPAVRIQQWVNGFGNHGLFETICASSLAPAMSQTAGELVKLLGPVCLPGNLVDTDLATAGIQPDCQVVDTYVNAQNQVVSTPLQSCLGNGGAAPCWLVSPNTAQCGTGLVPVIFRDPTIPLIGGLTTTFSCAECVAGQLNSGCP
jgi:hypothetical protein